LEPIEGDASDYVLEAKKLPPRRLLSILREGAETGDFGLCFFRFALRKLHD
jgi:hypothetical protein